MRAMSRSGISTGHKGNTLQVRFNGCVIGVLIIYKQLKRKVLSDLQGLVTGHRYLGLGVLDCTEFWPF